MSRRTSSQSPGDRAGPNQLLRVEDVAELLNVSRWFVYDHGEELGLVKIGGSNRYRLERVEAYIAACAAASEQPPRLARPPQSPRHGSRRVRLLETGR
jgi:predicted DNA-binding transcriptional regulator AlpA